MDLSAIIFNADEDKPTFTFTVGLEILKPTSHSNPTGGFRRPLSLAAETGGIRGGCSLSLLNLWATAALYFDVRCWLRCYWPLVFGLGLIAVVVWIKRRWLAIGLSAGGFLLVLGWWFCLCRRTSVTGSRTYAAAVCRIRWQQVTIHNIRNCVSQTDFTAPLRSDVRSRKLQRVDLFLVYWGSPHMAHTMVSFGFEGDEYVWLPSKRAEKGEGIRR